MLPCDGEVCRPEGCQVRVVPCLTEAKALSDPCGSALPSAPKCPQFIETWSRDLKVTDIREMSSASSISSLGSNLASPHSSGYLTSHPWLLAIALIKSS